jgi:competence protein ComEC
MLVLPVDYGDKQEGFEEVYRLAEEKEIPVVFLWTGDTFQSGQVTVTCLHPSEDFKAENENAGSQVLYLCYRDFSLLLTGDIEGEGEKALIEILKTENIRDVTVLKVAHHGSKYTTDTELAEWLRPSLSVISCGKNNRYGHPHEETIERLLQAGSVILCTKDSGAVIVKIKGGDILVGTYK